MLKVNYEWVRMEVMSEMFICAKYSCIIYLDIGTHIERCCTCVLTVLNTFITTLWLHSLIYNTTPVYGLKIYYLAYFSVQICYRQQARGSSNRNVYNVPLKNIAISSLKL